MSTESATKPLTEEEVFQRNLEISGAFTMAVLRNPRMLNDIPHGVTIIFLPEDDPELAAYNRTLIARVLDEGRDVWVRHVKPGEFPPLPPLDHNPWDDVRRQ